MEYFPDVKGKVLPSTQWAMQEISIRNLVEILVKRMSLYPEILNYYHENKWTDVRSPPCGPWSLVSTA